jgi:hypothetical protein
MVNYILIHFTLIQRSVSQVLVLQYFSFRDQFNLICMWLQIDIT